MGLHESGEMYLESIYILSQKNEYVRSLDVALYMGYSKPSISHAVGILKNNGLINVDGNGYLTLTPSGSVIALRTFERHTILTKLFVNLGVPEEVAAKDACKIEHYISDVTFETLKNHAGMYKMRAEAGSK